MFVTELLEDNSVKILDEAIGRELQKEPDHYIRVLEASVLVSRGFTIPQIAQHFSCGKEVASKLYWAVLEEWRLERASAFDWYSHVLHSLMEQKRELWASWEKSKKPKVRKTKARRINSGGDDEEGNGISDLTSKTSEITYGNPMIMSQIRAIDVEISKLTGLSKKSPPASPPPPGQTQGAVSPYELDDDAKQKRIQQYIVGVMRASEVKASHPIPDTLDDLAPEISVDIGGTSVSQIFGEEEDVAEPE